MTSPAFKQSILFGVWQLNIVWFHSEEKLWNNHSGRQLFMINILRVQVCRGGTGSDGRRRPRDRFKAGAGGLSRKAHGKASGFSHRPGPFSRSITLFRDRASRSHRGIRNRAQVRSSRRSRSVTLRSISSSRLSNRAQVRTSNARRGWCHGLDTRTGSITLLGSRASRTHGRVGHGVQIRCSRNGSSWWGWSVTLCC
jgi:hypothetical protein